MLVASLSDTAEEMDKPLIWAIGLPPRTPRAEAPSGVLSDVSKLAGGVRAHTASALTLTKRFTSPILPFTRGAPELVSGVHAPNSILNGRISRNRRFATQQYSLAQIKELSRHFDVTVNDVFLTIVGGGLHKFLGESGKLPEKSLVAFLPVNVRTQDDNGGGNAIGAILAKVGSQEPDPVKRLRLVSASAGAAKDQLSGMTKQGILAYSAYVMAPTGLQGLGAIAGIRSGVPINFNLCLSNVPGPNHFLYLRGSRLEASYPVSIPYHSMALNITMQSYADTVGIGFVGCRDTLPHLQRLAVYTGEALAELVAAAGLGVTSSGHRDERNAEEAHEMHRLVDHQA
jgi:diacylglycerol O-acyltransferase